MWLGGFVSHLVAKALWAFMYINENGYCHTPMRIHILLLPQTHRVLLSANPIHSQIGNPHDPDRIPGGSSSGEGALLAAGGSILGWGSDIGGSIRAPSHFCGVCGFKPTSSRIR